MRFSDAMKTEDPIGTIFKSAIKTVYCMGDGKTECLDRLSPEAKHIYLLNCFDGEIHNGGFDQLFSNSAGNHCNEMQERLASIGAMRTHALLTQAMAWFPDGRPASDRFMRQNQIAALRENPDFENAMNELDKQFYEYEDKLTPLLEAYIASHPDATVAA